MNKCQVLLGLPLVFLAACGGPATLHMSPLHPAYLDQSSVSPRLKTGKFDKIMIVPPSGTAGVEYQANLAAIERSFIARGITVISPAITSRVLLDDTAAAGGNSQKTAETEMHLSEVERALLLAKRSNADAVLQIGTWHWVSAADADDARRYFVRDRKGKTYDEVNQQKYEETKKEGRESFSADVLAFTGRLINVNSGEVVAAFKIDVPMVNVADPLTVEVDKKGQIQSESYDWAKDKRKAKAATNRAVSDLFDRLAELLSQGKTR